MLVLTGLSAFWLGAVPVVAQTLTYKKNPTPQLILPRLEGEAYAVFRRLDDVWVVSTSGQTPLSLKGSNSGRILEQESLYVRGGNGLRLRFEDLKSLNVTEGNNSLVIALNKPADIRPLKVGITAEEDRTILSKPLGTGDVHRATSFQTGESYIVLPTFLNRGTPDVREKGDVRQLKTAVGAIFVSREGLPVGYESRENDFVFSPMKDALSRATAQYRQKLSPEFIDSLLAQLTQAKEDVRQKQQQIAPADDEIKLPAITGENRATFAAAMNRMRTALDKVAAISETSRSARQPIRQQAQEAVKNQEAPQVETEALVADLQDKIQAEEAAAKKKPASAAAAQQVLSGDALFPDFGQRSAAEAARIHQRLKNDWVFAERPKKKTEAAHLFAAFLIQRERAPEALGVLQTLKSRLDKQLEQDEGAAEENPVEEKLSQTRRLEAIANIMLNRFADAAELLAKNEQSPHRDLWLGVARAGMEDHNTALPLLEAHIEAANAYPAMVHQAARYHYARTLFENERYADSMNQLDRLALLGGQNRFLAKAQLLMARNYEAQNQPDNAEQIYINLAGHPNKEVVHHALLYFMNLLNARGDLTPEAAIVRYENLRFNWRGDKVEEESLYQLSQLYIKTAQYRKALERLRSLTANFPESQHAEQAAAQMTRVYEDVIMGRLEGRNFSTLDILALYYDFRALTPSGEEGDKLVMHVAEKLANLGLYQRATDILERQLQFRVRDRDAVGQLGYDLAKIHGQNFEPEEGLKVLSRTGNSRLPQSLKNQRTVLKAELLGLDQRPEAALNTAQTVKTPAGQTLQASLAWELGRHKVIIDALADRFNSAGGADWSDEQATQFLQLVTALSRTGQRARLNQLRLNYQPGIAAHGLESQVLFLVQAADESTSLPEGVTLPENPTAFWPTATQALAQQNSFNNTYKDMRTRWKREKEQARQTEINVRNQELRRRGR